MGQGENGEGDVARIGILVMPGVCDSALSILNDVMRFACKMCKKQGCAEPYRLTMLSLDGESVKTASGQIFRVQEKWDAEAESEGGWDEVIIPGVYCDDTEEFEQMLMSSEVIPLYESLRVHVDAGKKVSAGCTGVYFLAEAGVLDGGVATTTWWLMGHFKGRYPEIDFEPSRIVVVSEKIRSAGAAMAHMDLALALVNHYCGTEVAHLVAEVLVLDGRSAQTRYTVMSHLMYQNEEVKRAEVWIRANLKSGVSVQNLASQLGVSTRTLSRRFKSAISMSPGKCIQKVRIEQALHLSQTTSMSHEQIAAEVGYEEVSSLRKVIRREMGASLTQLKRVQLNHPGAGLK